MTYGKTLYPATPVTKYGFLSQSFINYTALIGLTYIIAREAKMTNNIIKGWSMGFVMLLMTYLLPSNLTIIPIMDFADKLLTKNTPSLLTYKEEIVTSIGLVVSLLYYLFRIAHSQILSPSFIQIREKDIIYSKIILILK